MTRFPLLALVLGFFAFVLFAGAQTVTSSFDWCEVEYPSVAVIGSTLEVKVTPKGIGEGMKLAVDLHWSSEDHSKGGFYAFTDRQIAADGKTSIFRFRIQSRPDLGIIRPIIFLSPDGSFEKREQMVSSIDIPVGQPGQQSAAPASSQTQKSSYDWCEVEYPSVAVIGSTIEVKVTPRGIAEGMRLAVDLHWSSEDHSKGGFYAFTDRQAAADGKTSVFRFRIQSRADLGAIRPIIFLSPDGSFENREKTIDSISIPVGKPGQQAPTAAAPSVQKSSYDWCDLEYPSVAVVGSTLEVKITPKGVAEGMKLAVDLHWSSEDNSRGGFYAFAERQNAVNGKVSAFRFRIQAKEGLGSIRPIIFLTPDGSFEKREKTIDSISIPVGQPGQQSAAPGAQIQKSSSEWCDVEYPSVATIGSTIEVKVTPRGIDEGKKLAVDLHWSSTDGSSGGFYAFAERQNAADGRTAVFRFRINAREGLGAVRPIIFLTPDGSFEKREKMYDAISIPVTRPGQQGQSAATPEERMERPATVTYKKSWLRVLPVEGIVRQGDSFDVVVEYYLDPSDNWGKGTTLRLTPLGPWIDNPDGKYSTSRTHIGYYGMGVRNVLIQPGRGRQTFTYKAEHIFERNSLHFLATFVESNGEAWPWNVRGGGTTLVREPKHYFLGSAVPGNLFTYSQRPTAQIHFAEGAIPGETRTLKYTIVDTEGRETPGEFSFTVGNIGEKVDLPLNVERRGTFVLEGEVEGWGKREMVFAWIPEVKQVENDKPTPFGVTNVTSEEDSRIAQRLGFSWVRHFTGWKGLRPAKDLWTVEGMDRTLRINRQYGLIPWICLIDPPAWAQTGKPVNVGYHPYAFDAEALDETVRVLSERWRDLIWGWEWQNEIVPGNAVADPVSNYVEFCRVATQAAKSVDSRLQIQMAGGLWPRNYRADLLKRGIGNYVDVVPVHYSNLDGIRDVQEDLAAAGASRVRVWDNESARGLSVWKMPTREMLQVRTQSKYVLERWPDELVAGAEQITYFGGHSDPCGNWSYLLDPKTPRPVATTLAVLISKLGHADPVGKFHHSGGAFHLFSRNGKAIMVASAMGNGQISNLKIGSDGVVITDYQGNETTVAAVNGVLNLALDDMPVFIEGADLDVLKSYLTLTVGASNRPRPAVQLTAVKGEKLEVPVQVQNLYGQAMHATLKVRPQDSASSAVTQTLSIPAGERTVIKLVADATSDEQNWVATLEFADGRDPIVAPFGVAWVDPRMLGNLLTNGGFEAAADSESKADGWSFSSGVERISSNGELGTGEAVVKYSGADGWLLASQTIEFPAGQSMLYTLWAKTNDVIQGGSNVTYVYANGKKQDLYIPSVFQTPPSSRGWTLMTFRGNPAADVKEINFTPLVRVGKGSMLIDNVRVTVFEGSNFAAEAHKVSVAPKIDGDLADWNKTDPIPLLCENQLTRFSSDYKWTAENLSGVAYLRWDSRALYLAVEVIDDQMAVPYTGDRTFESDSVTIGIQPVRLGKDANDKAFAYYLSAASPGGGSGKLTLYRPEGFSGGLTAGQLAKDSSAYEVAIRRDGTRTIYEACFPWTELGGVQPRLGTKLGLSLRLDDNDGKGRAAAMTWGDGLHPAWEPSMFGILTLTE